MAQVLRTGQLVETSLVMAGEDLFAPGHQDSPVNVVFSRLPVDFAILKDVAIRLFKPVGQEPRPALRALVEHLNRDHFAYHRRVAVPREFAGDGPPLFVAEVYVYRRWLPQGFLQGRLIRCAVDGDAVEMAPLA